MLRQTLAMFVFVFSALVGCGQVTPTSSLSSVAPSTAQLVEKYALVFANPSGKPQDFTKEDVRKAFSVVKLEVKVTTAKRTVCTARAEAVEFLPDSKFSDGTTIGSALVKLTANCVEARDALLREWSALEGVSVYEDHSGDLTPAPAVTGSNN